MFENYPYLKRILVVFTPCAFVALVVAFVLYANSSMLFTPHGYLNINSVPESLSIAYNNTTQTVKANGNAIPMKPGTYTMSFTSEGFGAHSEKVVITKDQTSDVWFLLNPYTDTAKKEYADKKYNTVKEGIAGHNSYTSSQQLIPKYPALQILPINTLTYSLELCPPYATTDSSVSRIGICITVTDINDKSQIDAAISELTAKSYNPDDYLVTVNDHYYPTAKERANNYCPLLDSGVCTDASN